MKQSLKNILLGGVIGALLVPALTFAARTAAPVLTGLFPSSTLSVNLPSPINTSLGNNGTTTGSVASSTIYFAVTALDGVGETVPGTAIGTTSPNQAHGYILTWGQTPGATSYRVYFSTSTLQAFTQYFTATTTGQYTFTSTSSPVFVPSGIPTSNSAYVVNLTSNGNSWLNGGAVAIGTTTFKANMQLTVATTTASSSVYIGANTASGARIIMVDSTAGKTTCTELSTAAGVLATKAITCP